MNCRYFNTPQGCRFGSKCLNIHVAREMCITPSCVSAGKQHTHKPADCRAGSGPPKVHKLCTNPLCVAAGKQYTHTFETCGCKGGGAHAAYIASKKEAAIREKQLAKNILLDTYYPQILALVLQENSEGNAYDQIVRKYPNMIPYINRPVPEGEEIVPPAERLARRITGMILELRMSQLKDTLSTPESLINDMATAAMVLVEAANKEAEQNASATD